MALSLLSILGGGTADIASLAKGEKDQASLSSAAGGGFFANIMQGQANQPAVMAGQALAAKAQGQAITVLSPVALATDGLAALTETPADAALSFLQNLMQETGSILPEGAELPQWFRDRLHQAQGEAQPLTEQELSELAAETGLPSALLLAVLEPTPLASPALSLQITPEDIAQTVEFAQNALSSHSRQEKTQRELLPAEASTQAHIDADAQAEASADIDALLARLAQLPTPKADEAKTAYAQLSQWVNVAKTLPKNTASLEKPQATIVSPPTQEKPAADMTMAAPETVMVDATDASDKAGEAKPPTQQPNTASVSRADGAGNTPLQNLQGEARQDTCCSSRG